MAIKPSSNEAFYREVDEQLRRDQAAEAWNRYRWAIVGGVLALLAVIGGAIWYQSYRAAKAGEQGEALVSALESLEKGNAQAAAPELAKLEDSNIDGYRAAALFSRANAYIESNNIPAAVAALQGIAADEGLAETYRHAATVRQATLEFDRLQPQQIVQRLQPLARPGEPWFGSAAELIALAHMRQQRPDLAGPIFAQIAADETVPESIRSRAVQMAGALGVDATQQTSGGTQAAAQPGAAAAPATKG